MVYYRLDERRRYILQDPHPGLVQAVEDFANGDEDDALINLMLTERARWDSMLGMFMDMVHHAGRALFPALSDCGTRVYLYW